MDRDQLLQGATLHDPLHSLVSENLSFDSHNIPPVYLRVSHPVISSSITHPHFTLNPSALYPSQRVQNGLLNNRKCPAQVPLVITTFLSHSLHSHLLDLLPGALHPLHARSHLSECLSPCACVLRLLESHSSVSQDTDTPPYI